MQERVSDIDLGCTKLLQRKFELRAPIETFLFKMYYFLMEMRNIPAFPPVSRHNGLDEGRLAGRTAGIREERHELGACSIRARTPRGRA
jgi:hypothetical protein